MRTEDAGGDMGLRLMLTLATAAAVLVVQGGAAQGPVTWEDCLGQEAAWYGGVEAGRIADNVLLYQRESGGWPKNIDMAAPLGEAERAALLGQRASDDATIDNDATRAQLIYLARVFNAGGRPRFKDGFLRGLDYLLAAQYANGGWPQYYPKLTGYYRRITFNDDAMAGVLGLLREVARGESAYAFVDAGRRAKSAQAVERGVECILKCQVIVAGRRTAWCAQHDEVTLAPAPARSYEKVSLSGSESVGLVRLLMGVERPDARVIEAIQSAVAWLDRVSLSGIRLARQPAASWPKGYDLVVVSDERAGPLWARFYEIGTDRPIFCGRDGVIKYSLAEIEYERRTGYNWYTGAPAELLTKDYPDWQRKWAPGANVWSK